MTAGRPPSGLQQVLPARPFLERVGRHRAAEQEALAAIALQRQHQSGLALGLDALDRSFVKHAQSGEYQRVLIEATIRVARTLGMTTVAEGIETEGQAELMRRLDCDRGQGFLFAQPLEAAELGAWLRRHAEQLSPA